MFNFCKLFLVFVALLSVAAARPSILAPAIIPAAVSHASVTQIHPHPVVIASPVVHPVSVVHHSVPVIAGPIVSHHGVHPVVVHG